MNPLESILPKERILDRLIDRVSYASDAGFYSLLPRAVVRPVGEAEITALFRFAHAQRIPLVFRAGGTSLSGQSVTDGILVDLSQHWNRVTVEQGGDRVRVQPGITGARVNQRLKPFGRKIGPDPSSISAAMMGGILSNNASGMCCGTEFNSYHTVRDIRFILPNGRSYDTAQPDDPARFAEAEAVLAGGIASIRDRIRASDPLAKKIRDKYRYKTTVGYSLNAFLDFDRPIDIFAHVLIGGEGTLGFIAEALLETIPEPPCKSTAMLYFPGIARACSAVPALKAAGAVMVELMDRASLRSVEEIPGIDARVRDLPDGACALLVEFQQPGEASLRTQVDAFLAQCDAFGLLHFPVFTGDERERDLLWKIRKGLFPSVGAVRQRGTSVILEDVAFPLESLAEATLDLQKLFAGYRYDNAIIFGHAKDGNLHFVVTQSFDTAAEIDRYDRFIRDVVDLVVHKYGGTLKAEHGTGRNMAPFVETEWGSEAYGFMKELKALADPENILNPGVIINEAPDAHIRNLKAMPEVEAEVDKCIECGYCEPVCPSRDLTTSPRRRIVVRRALENYRRAGDLVSFRALAERQPFEMLDTCAVDGLCATACPVSINTGDLVKRLRRESHRPFANRIALLVARQFGWVLRGARLALRAGAAVNFVFGRRAMTRVTGALRKAIPAFPRWPENMPAPPSLRLPKPGAVPPDTSEAPVVYYASCITRLMGSYGPGAKSGAESFRSICAKANIPLRLPSQTFSSCCGQIFSSKGYQDAFRFKANRVLEELWGLTEEGRHPVVCDTSSCTYTLRNLAPALTGENALRFQRLTIWDSVEFIYRRVLPVCGAVTKKSHVVLHPVCSLKKMNIAYMMETIAAHFAERVTVPDAAGCCGMAGDRGFLVPELTRAATAEEAREVGTLSADGYYASTKTCELALSEATGKAYLSILHLVDEAMLKKYTNSANL